MTDNQEKAINIENSKILVSAGAGSGKTLVLSSRVAKTIEDGADLNNIVVLTFTKAAAAEMKQRIKQILISSSNERAREIAEKLETAQITTLHAFANKIIKQYFFELEIDPAFSVLDEQGAVVLKTQAADLVLKKLTEEKNEKFLDLVDVFLQNRKTDNLKDAIFNLHDFLCSLPNPNEFVELSKNLYKNNNSESLINFLIQELAERAAFFERRLTKLVEECKKEGATKLVDVLCEVELNLLRIKPNNTIAQAQKAVSDFFAPSKIMGGDKPELADKTRELKTQIKKFFDSMAEILCVSTEQNNDTENTKATERIEALFNLYQEFKDQYNTLKDQLNALDFADLERYLLQLLQSSFCSELKKSIKYLFVDEYQDTNRLQQAIYEAMKPEHCFYVGDVKQSIYGFRLAEPKIFQETRASFRKHKGEVITLDENFRSHQELIDFTNKLFAEIMTTKVGGEDYVQEGTMKKGGADFPKIGADGVFSSYSAANYPRVKIVAIKRAKMAAKEEEKLPLYSVLSHSNNQNEKINSAIAEGRALAKVLSKLSDARIYDAKLGKERRIESGDIAILSATRGEYLKTLLNAAKEEGYSFAPDTTTDIFQDADFQELLSLLKLVSNTKQDIPLFIVLSGFWGKLSADELATIKLACPGYSKFYETVETFANATFEDKKLQKLQQKVKNIYSFINSIRFESQFKPVSELIAYVLNSTGFLHYMLCKENGEQKQLLYDALKEQLFDSKINSNLDDFLWACDNVGFFATDAVSPSRGIAIYDQEGNTTRSFQNITVTTIHKSKGLEYPVVILVGAGRPFNREDLTKDFLLSKNFGLGLSSFNTLERIKSSNIIKNAIKLDLQKQELEEDIRLLYVAITRAINNLVIIGVGDPTESTTIEKNILSSGCFFDLIAKFFKKPFPPLYCSVSKESFEMLAKPANIVPSNIISLPENEKIIEELKQNFAFTYSHENATQLSKKYSVTELAEKMNIVEMRPLAAESTSEIGNAYHHIMQHINFASRTAENFAVEKARLISEGLVTEAEWALVDEQKILECLASPLFVVLSNGKRKILREQQFLMRATAKEIGLANTEEDSVMVQGVFDMVVFDGARVLIIDYKTGGAKSEQDLIKKHKHQMDLYKMAAERAFGKEVDVAIYSFPMGKLVRVN